MFGLETTNYLQFILLTVLVLKQDIFADIGDIVAVSLGNGSQIRGVEQKSLYEKRTYVAFKGIPFAEPPVGKLRFKV